MEEIAVVEEFAVRRPATIRSNAFFYHARTQEYLRGRDVPILENVVKTNSDETINVVLPTLVVAIVIAVITIQVWPWTIAAFALLAGLVAFLMRRMHEHQRVTVADRIRRDGYFIEGTLLSCVPYATVRGRGFSIGVTYEFQSPNDVTLQGSVQEEKFELSGTQLPAPGTPVYILYFNDKEHYLL